MQLSPTLVKCILSCRVLLSNCKTVESYILLRNSILYDLITLLNVTKIQIFCSMFLKYFIPFTVYDCIIQN